MMELFSVILKSLGLSFGIMAVVLVIFLVAALFWVRMTVKNSVYCYILSSSKQLKGRILKPESNTVIVGSGADAPKYLIHPSKQFWSFWPPGFPSILQEPIPTLFYVEGNAEPLDPYDRKSLISPESLRKISDEAMLKQTWKDVRETLGIKTASGNTVLLILVGVAAIAGAISAYMSFQSMNQIGEILKALGR